MDKGASLRDRATRPAAQAPSGLGDSASVLSAIPQCPAKLCRNCRFLRGVLLGALGGHPYCVHPASYQGGDFDPVSGSDGRRFLTAKSMRQPFAKCGPSGELFESVKYTTFADAPNPSPASPYNTEKDT